MFRLLWPGRDDAYLPQFLRQSLVPTSVTTPSNNTLVPGTTNSFNVQFIRINPNISQTL